MQTAKDLKISRKYAEYFTVVYKATALSSNSAKTRFTIYFEDSRISRRRLVVQNTAIKVQFMFDDEFCIYWTIANINGQKAFIYWSWPKDQGCPD